MASHIILPKEEEAALGVAVEEDHDSPAAPGYQHQQGPPVAKALPFSATCVRISRDSYPNLRALRNASAMSLPDDDAAYAKLEEGDYGYLLDDVPHFTDYLSDLPVSADTPPLPTHPCLALVVPLLDSTPAVKKLQYAVLLVILMVLLETRIS